MKILLLAPEFSRTKAWVTAHFCDEIARQSDVANVWSPMRPAVSPVEIAYCDMKRAVEDFQPDIVLMYRLQFGKYFMDLIDITVPKVCFVEDYFSRHYDLKNRWLRRHDFDLIFFSQQYFLPTAQAFQRNGDIPRHARLEWLPFSVDTDIYTGDPRGDRPIDVTFICSLHQTEEGYPNRRAVADALNKLQADRPDLSIVVRLLENKGGFLDPGGGIYGEEYARLLSQSKIVVASLDATGSVNYRHFEAMASGALLLTDGPPKDWEALGNVNALIYKDAQDLPGIILSYLGEAARPRAAIAELGQQRVREHHSNKIRVRQMLETIREVCGVE